MQNLSGHPETIHPTEEKIPKFLLVIILIVIVFILVVMGLLINQVFFAKKVPRTALEREYLYWKEACKQDKTDSRGLRELARAEFDLGMIDEAIEHMKQAIELAPGSRSLHYFLGKMYWVNGDNEKALEEYKKELEIAPHAPSCYDMGQIYLKMGEEDKAIECFEEVIERTPEDADAHIILGNLYEKNGDDELALQEYEEALKYIPGYVVAIEAIENLKKNNPSIE